MSAPNGYPTRSPIYVGPGSAACHDPADLYRQAWKRFGLVVVDPEDLNNDFDRQHCINIANRLYGKRGGR